MASKKIAAGKMGESLVNYMNKVLERLVGLLYPRRCPICGEALHPGIYICPDCEKTLKPIAEPRCKKCGKGLSKSEQEYCLDCAERTHIYTRGAAVLPYQGKIKQSVYQFKFHNKREYLDFYGSYMANQLKKEIRLWSPQVVIPVPLHPSKHRKRGYNQAEILAYHLGKCLNIPVNSKLVKRVRMTRPQKELLYQERQNNLKGAFKIEGYDVELKKVLLVDDIYTTGSTVDAIARVLKKEGVEEIYFVSLCIGRDDG